MANPRRASTIRTTRAAMAADRGPDIEHYNTPLDTPRLYRWVVAATDTVDNLTVLTHQGGTVGRWRLVRDDVKGAVLTDADETLTVGGNFYRLLSAAQTANRSKTMSITNAAAGDIVRIVRTSTAAFTLAIINGGPAAGTITTLPASQRWWVEVYFNGTDWELYGAAQMP